MSNAKKESKSYFNQLLYLTVAHKSEDAQKPYTVKQVIDMFKADDVKISIDQLTQSTDSGIQSLLNGMLDPKKKSKYDLYLYEKKNGNFCKVPNGKLSLKDLNSEELYLSEQANL